MSSSVEIFTIIGMMLLSISITIITVLYMILFIITDYTSIVNKYIVPCLNDKDANVLNKSLFYFKIAYEEAHATKESSIRIEAVLNNFIKEQFDHNQIENPNAGSSSNKTKGFSKK